jgi:hypothetical protein
VRLVDATAVDDHHRQIPIQFPEHGR